MQPLLTQDEAADLLKLSVRTLERMRVAGNGPPFIKLNRSVRYDASRLQAWLGGRVVRSTSEAMENDNA
jgi:excisionase family DNA binding protein